MWKKKGLIYNANGLFDWQKSHAQTPVVDELEDRFRIYYSTRSLENKSYISFIEVEKNNPKKIIYQHNKPILEHGKIGTFDDSGTMPSSIVNVGNKKYLYYIGWTTRGTVPYHNSIGLAISYDNGFSFKKISEGPIITVNYIEPYFSGTSFVLKEDNIFKMWYLSCIRWEIINNKPEPLYNIKYAESTDGIIWQQTGKIAIPLNEEENEGGIVSSTVIKQNNIYRMWYGVRKKQDYRINIENSYRIGYAESFDGINWIRKDKEVGIKPANNGWDAEMISYPYVIYSNERLLMFYNGNGFGKSGFGYAELKV